MAVTVDEFYNSGSQVSSRRTSAIRQALSAVAPGYSELSEEAKKLIPQAPDPGLTSVLGQWAASRDQRSLVHAKLGTSGKILASGVVLTPHDLKGVGHTGRMVSETSLAEIRARAEIEQGLPYYDPGQGQTDLIPGLRPTSGENIPRSLSEVRANELRATYGADIPIMHAYAYGDTVEKGELGFYRFGTDALTNQHGERIILRREVADRTRITSGDYLSDSNPSIPLSQISEGAQSSVLVGTDAEQISTQASRSGLEHIKSAKTFIPGRGVVDQSPKFETMTLGVGLHDIEAMIVQPHHIAAEDLSDPLKRMSAMNTIRGKGFDIGRMIHQSEQRMKAALSGIDYVQDNRVFDVELHNPAMTERFVALSTERKGFLPFPITMDELPKGATPFEAIMYSTKRAIDSGVEASTIGGLDTMVEGDRKLVSGIIGSHLEEYNKAKSSVFSGTVDDVLKINSGRLPVLKATVATEARVSSALPSIPNGVSASARKAVARVPRTAVMSPKTLENLLQSAVTATKIMR